jgi:hypothetical protein
VEACPDKQVYYNAINTISRSYTGIILCAKVDFVGKQSDKIAHALAEVVSSSQMSFSSYHMTLSSLG